LSGIGVVPGDRVYHFRIVLLVVISDSRQQYSAPINGRRDGELFRILPSGAITPERLTIFYSDLLANENSRDFTAAKNIWDRNITEARSHRYQQELFQIAA
ncbi:MAG: hypothetical protein OXI10_01790, partial [Gammaproteobacteria bacterium]|nr:hypothetical protein [Gammaproteobacteria bacterium]